MEAAADADGDEIFAADEGVTVAEGAVAHVVDAGADAAADSGLGGGAATSVSLIAA